MTLQRKERLKMYGAIGLLAALFSVAAIVHELEARQHKCPKCGAQMEHFEATNAGWIGNKVYKCPNQDCRFIDTREYRN